MKTAASWIPLLSLTLISLSVGCNDDSFQLAEVSGTVTLDGTPLTDAVVVFMPEPRPGNSVVGPFSSASTDSQGRFTLETRYGDPGAVVGLHLVTVQYDDVDPLAIERFLSPTEGTASLEGDEPFDGLEQHEEFQLDDVVEPGIGDQPGVEDVPKIGSSKAWLTEKLNGRRLIPPRFALEPILEFSVPASGSTSANFDLESEPSAAVGVK
jgi:hypothetical protein